MSSIRHSIYNIVQRTFHKSTHAPTSSVDIASTIMQYLYEYWLIHILCYNPFVGAKEAYGFDIGDHVISENIVPCWDCRYCKRGSYNMCKGRGEGEERKEYWSYNMGGIVHVGGSVQWSVYMSHMCVIFYRYSSSCLWIQARVSR